MKKEGVEIIEHFGINLLPVYTQYLVELVLWQSTSQAHYLSRSLMQKKYIGPSAQTSAFS